MVKELVNIAHNLEGNIYLAKDAILNERDYNKKFNINEFSKVRHPLISSEQSRRLNL